MFERVLNALLRFFDGSSQTVGILLSTVAGADPEILKRRGALCRPLW